MDAESRHRLDRILGRSDHRLELEKQRARERAIQERRHRRRFEELADSELRPTLRDVMHRLQTSGHLTRLRTMSPECLRLDIQVPTAERLAGLVEVELLAGPEGRVRCKGLRNLAPLCEETLDLDELDGGRLTGFLVTYLERLLS